jgi:ribose 5-phosphate isomerase B
MSAINTQKPIIIGCDHAAYTLKEIVKAHLTQRGLAVEDAGTHSEESVDYPDIGAHVAGKISRGEFERGILICGTGIGMSIVANRFPRVRATLCNDLFSAQLSRRHNDANILVFGGRIIGDVLAKEIVDAWLDTPFEGGRHRRRVDKLEVMGG